jgi:hypothetical protein
VSKLDGKQAITGYRDHYFGMKLYFCLLFCVAMKHVREGYRPKVCESRVLRRIFGSERGLI